MRFQNSPTLSRVHDCTGYHGEIHASSSLYAALLPSRGKNGCSCAGTTTTPGHRRQWNTTPHGSLVHVSPHTHLTTTSRMAALARKQTSAGTTNKHFPRGGGRGDEREGARASFSHVRSTDYSITPTRANTTPYSVLLRTPCIRTPQLSLSAPFHCPAVSPREAAVTLKAGCYSRLRTYELRSAEGARTGVVCLSIMRGTIGVRDALGWYSLT